MRAREGWESSPDDMTWRCVPSMHVGTSSSVRGSEKVPSRCAQAVDQHGSSVKTVRESRFEFGMCSVVKGSSVGAAEKRPQSSAYSHRTGSPSY